MMLNILLRITIPTIIIASRYGFQTMFVARTLTKLWLLSLHLIAIFSLIRLSPFKIIGNILPELIGCGIMVVITYSLSSVCGTAILQLASILVCITTYWVFLLAIGSERHIIKQIWGHVIKSNVKNNKAWTFFILLIWKSEYSFMIFNSLEFLLFFPAVCLIYFLLRENKFRNPFLLIASYYFYMNWQPIYALLLLSSTILTYCCGLLTDKYNSNTS